MRLDPPKIERHRILALSPGGREVGYALFCGDELEDWGVKNLPSGSKATDPNVSLMAIGELISETKPDILLLGIEYGAARGLERKSQVFMANRIELLAKAQHISLRTVSLNEAKKAICGKENASGRELSRAIMSIYPELGPINRYRSRGKYRYWQCLFKTMGAGLVFKKGYSAPRIQKGQGHRPALGRIDGGPPPRPHGAADG